MQICLETQEDCWKHSLSSQPDFISMQTFEHLHAITNIQDSNAKCS